MPKTTTTTTTKSFYQYVRNKKRVKEMIGPVIGEDGKKNDGQQEESITA